MPSGVPCSCDGAPCFCPCTWIIAYSEEVERSGAEIGRVPADLDGGFASLALTSLDRADVWLTAVKGIVFGAVIGTVPALHGLRAKKAATQVPIAASLAVVVSIVGIFLFSVIFVVVS